MFERVPFSVPRKGRSLFALAGMLNTPDPPPHPFFSLYQSIYLSLSLSDSRWLFEHGNFYLALVADARRRLPSPQPVLQQRVAKVGFFGQAASGVVVPLSGAVLVAVRVCVWGRITNEKRTRAKLRLNSWAASRPTHLFVADALAHTRSQRGSGRVQVWWFPTIPVLHVLALHQPLLRAVKDRL